MNTKKSPARKTNEPMSKENYDGMAERYHFAVIVEDQAMSLLEMTIEKIRNELSFASNETVDKADFENIRIKLEEIIKAARSMQTDNLQ